MKKFKSFLGALAIVLFVVFLLSKRGCEVNLGEGFFNQVLASDTTFVEVVDTSRSFVILYDTIYQKEYIKISVEVPTPTKTKDVSEVFGEIVEQDLNHYQDSVDDGKLRLKYDIVTEGTLESFDFSYLLLTPEKIVEERSEALTITKTITKTITNTVYKGGLFVGGGITFSPKNENSGYYAGLTFTTKNRLLVEGAYDFINDEYSIGVKFRIFPFKK